MSRPAHPPRLRRLAVVACALSLAGAAACSDTAGPDGAGGPLDVTLIEPGGDTLTQRGLGLRVTLDDAEIQQVRLYLDSGGPAERRVVSDRPTPYTRWAQLGLFAVDPGTYRITVAVTDVRGRTLSRSHTRTFRIDDAPYTVTPLPDLGAGAAPLGLSARGDVAGWVRTATGSVRPAVWKAGELQVLAVDAPDSIDVQATRVNAAGDVLLQYEYDRASPYTGARVRRADGALLTIRGDGPPAQACCRTAADLSEDRVAVAMSYVPHDLFEQRSIRLDVARDAVLTDSMGIALSALNGRGQAVGIVVVPGFYPSRRIVTLGLPAPWTPSPPSTGAALQPCGAISPASVAGSSPWPLGLDDDGNVLGFACTSPFFAPPAGASVHIDRYVGPGPRARLAPSGGLVAAADSAPGAIFLWRAGTARTLRVRVAGDAWRFDHVAAVNAAGQIAARGRNARTGERAALLLTPAAP